MSAKVLQQSDASVVRGGTTAASILGDSFTRWQKQVAPIDVLLQAPVRSLSAKRRRERAEITRETQNAYRQIVDEFGGDPDAVPVLRRFFPSLFVGEVSNSRETQTT